MNDEAKILLVDDQEENLVALSAVLKMLPATVVCARSGEDALRALMMDDFAVILLDVVMPGMDGFETAYHIKRKDRTKNVPIIFLTAASNEPDLAFRGYAVGAVDYLVKPFDPWVLRAKVSLLVELHEQRRRANTQAALLTGLFPGATDLTGGSRLVDELEERLTDLEVELSTLVGQAEDGAVKEQLLQLDRRVTRLRAAHRALFSRGGGQARQVGS
jgi:DNA-binding response OmpR family regulator